MEPPFDVLVCGGGPVGTMHALLLCEAGFDPARIALVDARSVAQAEQDDRMIAISEGSRALLSRVGAWDEKRATPIHRIHVSHRKAFGRTLIDGADYGVAALGYVVRYGDLSAPLNAALARSKVHIQRGQRIERLEIDAASVTASLSAGPSVSAGYAVHAEGGLYGAQAPRPITRDYEQTAIVGFVTCEVPVPNQAWERFTENGPIALLPARLDAREGLALVWCNRPDEAARRAALADPEFLTELHRAFGDRLGRFLNIEARATFALGLNAVREVATHREFAIGNAAQTLHPVAGQGLNLGLRDAFSLCATLVTHFDRPAECMAEFRARRERDRAATVNLTDLLPRIFSSRVLPIAALRGAALTFLDLVSPARDVLARQMMDGQRSIR